jgi:hypothetical protein
LALIELGARLLEFPTRCIEPFLCTGCLFQRAPISRFGPIQIALGLRFRADQCQLSRSRFAKQLVAVTRFMDHANPRRKSRSFAMLNYHTSRSSEVPNR